MREGGKSAGGLVAGVLSFVFLVVHAPLIAQTSPGQELPTPPATQAPSQSAPATGFRLIPLPPQAPLSNGQLALIALETRFAEDVAQNGGKAFASWFEDDAVALSNGQAAVRGRAGIAATANWSPEDYTLTWVAEGAEMGPSNDMGYTWGRYQGRSKSTKGQPIVQSGRYITVWKKQGNGQWKVALDASADAPATGSMLPMFAPPAGSSPAKRPPQ